MAKARMPARVRIPFSEIPDALQVAPPTSPAIEREFQTRVYEALRD